MIHKIKVILTVPIDIWQMIVTYLPGPLGYILRRNFWRRRLDFLGKNVIIDVGVYFQNAKYISIDDNCWIDRNVIILAGQASSKRITYYKENTNFKLDFGMVRIGENTHIAPNCVLSGIAGLSIGKNCGVAANSCLYSFSHHYRNLEDRNDSQQYSFTPRARMDQQSMLSSPIVIEDYCAIGLCCVILPGVTLKRGSWIASNMVISNNYEPQTLVYAETSMKTKDLSSYTIRE
jgi:acetyltransferase-like isoleucine patch superfamily enzyme